MMASLRLERLTLALVLAWALGASLAACGGGSDAETSTVPAEPSTPATPTTYTPDLTSFAVAWTSLQIAQTAFDVLIITGGTGDCGVSGTTAYDASALRQTLSACVTHVAPDRSFTGSWTATSTTTGSSKTVTMSDPSLVVTDPAAPTEPQLAIAGGTVNGADDFSSDTLDTYTGVGFSFDAQIGASTSVYHVASSAAATASQGYANGVATLTVASAAIGVSYAGNAWQVTAQNVRSVGDNRPDQGTMTVADQSQSSTAAFTVTFGAGNTLQFANGGQTVTKNWNDADVQAALLAAKQ